MSRCSRYLDEMRWMRDQYDRPAAQSHGTSPQDSVCDKRETCAGQTKIQTNSICAEWITALWYSPNKATFDKPHLSFHGARQLQTRYVPIRPGWKWGISLGKMVQTYSGRWALQSGLWSLAHSGVVRSRVVKQDNLSAKWKRVLELKARRLACTSCYHSCISGSSNTSVLLPIGHNGRLANWRGLYDHIKPTNSRAFLFFFLFCHHIKKAYNLQTHPGIEFEFFYRSLWNKKYFKFAMCVP
jgi:hypothetical protein